MRKISILLLLAFTFVFLYTPQLTIFPLNVDILIYGVMALAIRLVGNVWEFIRVPGLNKAYFCILLLLFYATLKAIAFPDNNVGMMDLNIVHVIRFLIEVIIFPYVLVKLFVAKEVFREEIVKYLTYLAIFQAYISVLMIFEPPFKDFVTSYIITFNEGNRLLSETLLNERVFGIGSEYLFALPIFQAMMACVYISVTTKKSVFFFFNLICLICSAIFCARTSLLVFVCYFFYYYSLNFSKHPRISIITMGIIGGCVYMAYDFLMSIDDIVAIEHFNKAFNGQYEGGYDNLLDRMLFFPEDLITWVFGDGTYPFFAKRNSDIGYVNDLFFGGLLYLSLEFLSLYFLFDKARKADYLQRILPLLFMALIVLHYKGSIYGGNNFMKGIMIMYYAVFIAKSEVMPAGVIDKSNI